MCISELNRVFALIPEQERRYLSYIVTEGSNQRVAYAALFMASSQTLKKLTSDPKFIGGDLPGFFGVLHTWGRQLQYHLPNDNYTYPSATITLTHLDDV